MHTGQLSANPSQSFTKQYMDLSGANGVKVTLLNDVYVGPNLTPAPVPEEVKRTNIGLVVGISIASAVASGVAMAAFFMLREPKPVVAVGADAQGYAADAPKERRLSREDPHILRVSHWRSGYPQV